MDFGPSVFGRGRNVVRSCGPPIIEANRSVEREFVPGDRLSEAFPAVVSGNPACLSGAKRRLGILGVFTFVALVGFVGAWFLVGPSKPVR